MALNLRLVLHSKLASFISLAMRGRTSILQMWILKGYTFNKSSDDFIMNIQ
ncbi:hypothetical protein [Rickettsia endosymbiont of Cantharis rufa]|uniref:hypothetical protein n=1 Tax=Rickettsia endosymbiont of Cantharis rufa TaxID=3066248 RepID=UPI003132FF6D